jgi:uncharacterized membrane protein
MSRAESQSDVEIVLDSEQAPSGEVKPDVPARVFSSVLGLMGFGTALLVGLFAGNPGITILYRAILAMAICAVVGRVIGMVGEAGVREFLKNYKHDRPMPEVPAPLQRLYKARADDEAMRQSMSRRNA